MSNGTTCPKCSSKIPFSWAFSLDRNHECQSCSAQLKADVRNAKTIRSVTALLIAIGAASLGYYIGSNYEVWQGVLAALALSLFIFIVSSWMELKSSEFQMIKAVKGTKIKSSKR